MSPTESALQLFGQGFDPFEVEMQPMRRGRGVFSCQTMIASSALGSDGKMHTEKFASSAVGNRRARIQEVKQAYSNSRTGIDKRSVEQQIKGRGRKTVDELDHNSGEKRRTNKYLGMTEEQVARFAKKWQRRAIPRLPTHGDSQFFSITAKDSPKMLCDVQQVAKSGKAMKKANKAKARKAQLKSREAKDKSKRGKTAKLVHAKKPKPAKTRKRARASK